jgi:hypothetical protein
VTAQDIHELAAWPTTPLAAGLAMLIFRHADKHGSRHATAWGVFTFLADRYPALLPQLLAQGTTTMKTPESFRRQNGATLQE